MTGHDEWIENALAQQFDEITIGEELHAVPPHLVHAVTVDGRRAVCKVATGPQAHLRREAAVLRYAGRETGLPVPAVLAAADGFFVAEWLDAVPRGDEPTADPDWARAAGAGLATLHVETSFDAPGVPQAEGGALAVQASETTAEALAASLEDLRPGVVDTGYVDVLDDVIAFLEANPGAFEVHGGAGEPVLCHGNWVPDHVAVDGDGVAAVIDFERAVVAPAEHDYWRSALPLFHASGGTLDEAGAAGEAFRAGYESVRPLSPGFEARRDLHWLVITAAFLESLFVQDQHDSAGTERRAERFREYVERTLADIEASLS